MMSQIHALKSLGEGADPATFYAPLGCTSSAGRLYRRDAQYGVDDDREDWRVEVCFFSVEEGLSGWKRSALLMRRGWFVPISAEAAKALEAYMGKLGPVNALRRGLVYKNNSLLGAQQRLLYMKTSGDVGLSDVMRRDRQKTAERIGELEGEIKELRAGLKKVEAFRQEAQDVLLSALGWEELTGGENDG